MQAHNVYLGGGWMGRYYQTNGDIGGNGEGHG